MGLIREDHVTPHREHDQSLLRHGKRSRRGTDSIGSSLIGTKQSLSVSFIYGLDQSLKSSFERSTDNGKLSTKSSGNLPKSSFQSGSNG
ncbi:BnaA08g29180D [Brassica napus]|uniref:BnaA08g29180D protein n=1 Tax=Brassica napus TaxID=3708 RepID=A0A078ISS6_BRANA|nr:BnaA08g29180D [Brassica napus]